MSQQPESTPAGYLDLLRQNPDFRRLYSAHALSLLGDWFNTIAILLLLTKLTGSSAQSIGLVLVLKLLPIALLGPVAGVVADRYSRKSIMIVSDLLRAGVVLSVLLVEIFPHAWIIHLATGVQMAISAFFEPARTASIPNVVPKDGLARANALSAVTWSAMFTLGAALGGVFTDRFGWQAAVVLDAGTYIVSALLLAGVTLPRRVRPKEKLNVWQLIGGADFVSGARYMASQPRVRSLLFVKASWGLSGAITLFLTVFGQREYAFAGSTALGISFLFTARALGTGLGPLLGRRFTHDDSKAMHRLLRWCWPWAALWYVLFTLVHDIWLGAACVLIAHLAGSVIWVFSTVLLQQAVPDEFRGRVFAAELGLVTITMSASILLYSVLIDAGAPPRMLMLVMASTLIIPTLWWWRVSRGVEQS